MDASIDLKKKKKIINTPPPPPPLPKSIGILTPPLLLHHPHKSFDPTLCLRYIFNYFFREIDFS